MTQDLNCDSGPYDCIIFYRWFTADGLYERGRIMARLVAEILERMNVRVWLDQHEMSQSATREQVIQGIRRVFAHVQSVIILAAPGDWQRFTDEEDIHRWEWELSLNSADKPVWLLQHGFQPGPNTQCHRTDLASRLELFDLRLSQLVLQRKIHIRTISTGNIDHVMGEIAKNTSRSVDRPLVHLSAPRRKLVA
ncbi:hypothetical protein VTN00DRAFT_3313 [Thermoascus crustaceus]|uniref:uncharacterized protein n=1 Tax=Thermoascus crustaceus TaxID=5088 RepID=UPI003743BBDD